MKSRKTFCIITGAVFAAIILLSQIPQNQAYANIGLPPMNPSGASPGVGAGVNSNVRMVSEKVDLTIESYNRSSAGEDMRGLVEASFQMRNLGHEQETLDVWFPLAASIRYPDLIHTFSDIKDIKDFKVWVGGVPVKTEIVKAPDLSNPQLESNWAKFPITFPARQDVIVRVTYTIYPSGDSPFGGFEYILQTGAGWKDTIGEAEITVHLPYNVHPDFVSLSGKSIFGLPLAPNPPGYIICSNTIRWKFTDIEPTAEDNIFVEILNPENYRKLLQARARVQSAPDSVDAQLELANAASNAVVVVYVVQAHGGGWKVAEEANAAYRRALELAPQRADIYSQYANWLIRYIGINFFRGFDTCPKELCDLVRRGLEAFPNDPELNRIDAAIRSVQSENATQSAIDTPYSLTETAKAEETVISGQTATAQAVLNVRAVYATITSVHATRRALIATRTPTQSIQPTQTASLTPVPTSETAVPVKTSERTLGITIATLLPLGLIVAVLVVVWLRRNRVQSIK